MPKSRLPSPHTCPRCNYDQSGLIATWTDTCPTKGLCSECGYTFEWSDVMNPERRRLRGFFEHTSGFFATWSASLRTLLWTLWPGWFWSRVKLHHEPRLRMYFWIPVWLSTIWMLVIMIRLAARIVWVPTGQFTYASVLNCLTEPVGYFSSWRMPGGGLRFYWWIQHWTPAYLGLIGQVFIFPFLLLILPETARRAKVRPMHILRAAIYGLAWFAIAPLIYLADALEQLLMDPSQLRIFDVLYYVESHYLYLIALSATWIGVWWWMVLTRAFCIEKPLFHWFMLMIPAVLLVAISLVFDKEFVHHYLW